VPPQQPAYAAAAAQAPAKKTPVALILIIIAVVALLCGALACGIGAFLMLSSVDFEENTEQADVHYDGASAMVEELDTYFDYYEEAYVARDSAQLQTLQDEVGLLISDARYELDEAQSYIEPLEESGFKTEYLDAVALMRQSIDMYQACYESFNARGPVFIGVDDVLDELDEADSTLYESVDLINEGEYETAKELAEQALAVYEKGLALMNEMAAEYPGLEFELQAAREELWIDAARAAAAAAQAGIDGNNAAYQRQVDAYDAADQGLGDAPRPFWGQEDGGGFFETELALYDEAWSFAQASWEAWDNAWLAWEEGDY
jgi:hypothetical protein